MSKNCKDCEYFAGYDYSDGTPICNCEDEEGCPFNEVSDVKYKGMKVEIDVDFLSDYIRHTIMNTTENEAHRIAEEEIKAIVTLEYKDTIVETTQNAIKAVVDKQVSEFMSGEIEVGGGWSEPSRKISRNQYLSELVEKELSKRTDKSGIQEFVGKTVKPTIDRYMDKLKDDVNFSCKQLFDEATRKTLADNVVNLLMANDTYKRLSDSAGRLIGG